MAKHTKDRDAKAIQRHYDVSNDFYRLWLDREMIYSCAYFKKEHESLEAAQQNKLDHVCRKLRLKDGEKLLDIGCGWGGMIRWAAKNYGARSHGITISRNQYEYAREKIREEGLADRCTVELRDYRDIPGEELYDKIVSIGMFEHVGIKNLPLYFKVAHRLLKDKGFFLNHGITGQQNEAKDSTGTKFINTYVFPDGELTNMSNILQVAERSGFEVLDVESLRKHYAKTLRHWVERLQKNNGSAISSVGETTYRIWLIYMVGCSYNFERGSVSVYQALLSKQKGGGLNHHPLTREHIYR